MIRSAPCIGSLLLCAAVELVSTRAVAQPKPQPSPLAAYVPGEGFRLRSENGNYALRLGLLMGITYEPVWTNGNAASNGVLAFVRPVMSGSMVKPWIRYMRTFELAAPSPFLLLANVDVEPWEFLGLTVGQQVTPVSRHLVRAAEGRDGPWQLRRQARLLGLPRRGPAQHPEHRTDANSPLEPRHRHGRGLPSVRRATGALPGITSRGAWGQLLANVYERRIGVGARLGWLDPSTDLSNDRALEAEGQIAWFIDAPELAPFCGAVGTTNLLTLQLTAAF